MTLYCALFQHHKQVQAYLWNVSCLMLTYGRIVYLSLDNSFVLVFFHNFLEGGIQDQLFMQVQLTVHPYVHQIQQCVKMNCHLLRKITLQQCNLLESTATVKSQKMSQKK